MVRARNVMMDHDVANDSLMPCNIPWKLIRMKPFLTMTQKWEGVAKWCWSESKDSKRYHTQINRRGRGPEHRYNKWRNDCHYDKAIGVMLKMCWRQVKTGLGKEGRRNVRRVYAQRVCSMPCVYYIAPWVSCEEGYITLPLSQAAHGTVRLRHETLENIIKWNEV